MSGPLSLRRRPEPPSAIAAARLLNSAASAPAIARPVVNPGLPAPGPIVDVSSAPVRAAAAVDAPAPQARPGPSDEQDRLADGEGGARDLRDPDLRDPDLDDPDLDDGDFDDDDLFDFDDLDVVIGPGGERILWSAPVPPNPHVSGPRFPGPTFPGSEQPRTGALAVAVAERGAADGVAGSDAANSASAADPTDPPVGAGTGRTRVVLSERKGIARPVRNVVELQESGTVGDLLRRNLIGSQLTVAMRFAAGGGLVLLMLPALFWAFPAIGSVAILGFRLPWLLLGVAVYPFLLGLGLWFTRTAERAEKNFADQVQDS